MVVDQRTSQQLHKRLPIDAEEEILGVFHHHWFAYASALFIGVLIIIAVLLFSILLTSGAGSLSEVGTNAESYRTLVLGAAAVMCIGTALGTYIPVWLRSQEQLVVTDEAILQILQPSLFASKVSQLSLEHVTDVSVRKDFFGSIFGFGKVTVETPGEQDNYTFSIVSDPDSVARQIISVAESFNAALQSGRIPSRMHAHSIGASSGSVKISSTEYEEFQKFQAYRAEQQAKAVGEAAVDAERQEIR